MPPGARVPAGDPSPTLDAETRALAAVVNRPGFGARLSAPGERIRWRRGSCRSVSVSDRSDLVAMFDEFVRGHG